MAKYTGPVCRLSRRAGRDLEGLKSRLRSLESKCKKFNQPPGQHGPQKKDKGNKSNYARSMNAKYCARRTYGVLERQFRRYYREAARQKGSTGEVLLQLLERRLDNVVYRMGFAVTRAEARQLVSHRSILVNGKIVNIPSYMVAPGDVVEVKEKSKSQARIQVALELAQQLNSISDWLAVDVKAMQGTFKYIPQRSELPADFNEQLIVELYSK